MLRSTHGGFMIQFSGLKSEELYGLSFFSELITLGLPVISCIDYTKTFLTQKDLIPVETYSFLDQMKNNILNGSEIINSEVFKTRNEIENNIIHHKVKVGLDLGSLDKGIYEAVVLVLLYRKLKSEIYFKEPLVEDVSMLHKLLKNLDSLDAISLFVSSWSEAQVDPEYSDQPESSFLEANELNGWLLKNVRSEDTHQAGQYVLSFFKDKVLPETAKYLDVSPETLKNISVNILLVAYNKYAII